MHAHAMIGREDADGVGRFVSTLGVDGVVGQPSGTRHVRPRQLACSAHPRLVVMQHRRVGKRDFDLLLDRLQGMRRLLDPAHHCPARQAHAHAHAHAHAQEVGEQLLRATQRQVLLLDEIDGERTHPRTVLRSAGCLGGKRADTDMRAGRTAHMHRLMLPHHQARHGGKVVDLPSLAQHDVGVGKRCLALGAVARAMLHHLIRLRHQMQRLPAMAQLSTRLLAALLA